MTAATLLSAPVTGISTRGLPLPATPTRSARVALAGSVTSVPPVVLLHVEAPPGLSAAQTTISDYVVTSHLGIPLFAMTTGALAVAGIAVARGLADTTRTVVARTLLVCWALGLLATAAFPTNPPGTPSTVSSTVHLIAGAVVFALLPVAGLVAWRGIRDRIAGSWTGPALLVTSLASGLLGAALILNRLPGVLGADRLLVAPGLLQRAAGAVEIVLAAVLSLALLCAARSVRPVSR